jgi:hypothetical protein
MSWVNNQQFLEYIGGSRLSRAAPHRSGWLGMLSDEEHYGSKMAMAVLP